MAVATKFDYKSRPLMVTGEERTPVPVLNSLNRMGYTAQKEFFYCESSFKFSRCAAENVLCSLWMSRPNHTPLGGARAAYGAG